MIEKVFSKLLKELICYKSSDEKLIDELMKMICVGSCVDVCVCVYVCVSLCV